MAVGQMRKVTALLQQYGWDVEYFKGFILGLVWLGLYRANSRYEAFLDLEEGTLSSEQADLLGDFAAEIEQDIMLDKYRFSPGCKVDTSSLGANYKKNSKLFQWATGVYVACRIVEVMVEDGDITASSVDAYLMDRISESVFPFLDKKFAQDFFSEVNALKLNSQECVDLLVKLRKNLPRIIREITLSSQVVDNSLGDDTDSMHEPLEEFTPPIENVHSYFAGMTDMWAINETIDRLLPAVMAGRKQVRVRQVEALLQYAEKALGESFFKENAGMFWGVVESRCYMRVLVALGEAYRDVMQRERALECYEKSIELCRMDNLGVRYLLAELYLELRRVDDAIALIDNFEFDDGTIMSFTLVVALYAKYGGSQKAKKALRKAMECNPFVAEYLLGSRIPPEDIPDYYEPGTESEAIIYVNDNQLLWRNTQGLLEWLKKELENS